MTAQTNKKAVIYCRVSSVRQTTHGNGLESQETRCREFAQYRGYEIIETFSDDMSGSIIGRPGMQAMLKFLRNKRKQELVVIIDDISRLARGLEAHLQLRSAIASAGATLESPSIEFGEDSDSILVENLLASVSQHQRQKNGEQTMNRMRARMLNGYWVFQAPKGYRFERQPGGGKLMVPDEPLASIMKEALEGFACGRFASQAEVKRFFEAQPEFPQCRHGVVLNETVNQLLTQPLFSGYLEYPKWGISLRKGQHEGLISLETFEAIQNRLNSTGYAIARKDISEDFPLRGIVCCSGCGHPMTACWSKGRNALYPYYLCRQRGCSEEKKSIARSKVEDALHDLVKALTPAPPLFRLANEIFSDFWQKRANAGRERATHLRLEIGQIERKLAQVVDRLIEADNGAIIKAYEQKVSDLERQKLILKEKVAKCGTPARDYQSTFQTALKFLANPWNLWESGRIEDRRAMLKLVFGGKIVFDRFSGFQTPEISLPFKALGRISGAEKEMVPQKGLEPPTPTLRMSCSTI